MVASSQPANFCFLATAKFTPFQTAKQLAAGITQMIDLYARGGFQVGTILMDNEFEKL
jgi:hypothetical protein